MSRGNISTTRGVTYPGRDAREALVLIDQQLQLACKFLLLRRIREDSLGGTVCQGLALQWAQCRHILDYHKTKLIACLVEQLILDFDLQKLLGTVIKSYYLSLTCLRSVLNPRLFRTCRSYTIASFVGGV